MQHEIALLRQEEKKQEEMSEIKSKLSKLDDEKETLQDQHTKL